MKPDQNLPYVNVPETIGYAPDKKTIESALRRMAGYIQEHTSYHFIHKKTGEITGDSSKLPVIPEVKLQSLFNDWKYWNGVNHLAFRELSNAVKDNQYIQYAQKNYEFLFQHMDFHKKMFNARVPGASVHQFFRLDRLDDFGAMAAGLFETYELDPKPEYKQYLEKVMDYIANKQDRLDDSTFCRRRFGYTQIWGDDLYMSVPFLVRAWNYSGNNNYLEDAVQQVFNFRNYLYRPENGLYFHYRTMEEGHPGVAHWGRANGWMVMAQCQLLSFLPKDHPKRNDLIGVLKEHLIGLSRFQTANGMWRQLLDKSDSFLESSCTAMFTYGIAKAINEGWISDIYTSIAINGWKGLLNECITATGYFDKVTTGFNYKQDLPFYYNIPIEPGGDHGIGAAIYAGIEMYKLKKEYRDAVWC
jgi:rhamnogalacturonyl hydrolase YesR